jgi:hypothetical protein
LLFLPLLQALQLLLLQRHWQLLQFLLHFVRPPVQLVIWL